MSVFLVFWEISCIFISMKTGIYKIENVVNRKLYIGSTATMGFQRRWWAHRKQLRKNKHPNQHLQHAWNQYGEQTFCFKIIEKCAPDQCIIREQYYIDTLRPQYNILQVAGSVIGYRHTPLSKQKIGNASRGKNNAGYLGEYVFYNPHYGYFTGGLAELWRKFGLQKSISYRLRCGELDKSHGWIYVGKSGIRLPENIDDFYYKRIHNHRHIYSFYHKTKGIFTGVIPDFMKKNNIEHQNQSTISSLIRGKRKMAWGWIFVGEGRKRIPKNINFMYNEAIKQNSKANSRMNNNYMFVTNDHTFTGTIRQFTEKYNLNDTCVRRLVAGGRTQYRGWTIKS